MQTLSGQKLIDTLRNEANKINKKLWIAVPYIGTKNAATRILGNEWLNNLKIDVRLITDISTSNKCIDTETCKLFYDRGKMRSIKGLHAKMYIIDDQCLVTSANLTKTAFTKRHEIGFFLNRAEAKEVISIFETWWNKADEISTVDLKRIYSEKKYSCSEENDGDILKNLFYFPDAPEDNYEILPKFSNYSLVCSYYDNFCNKYLEIQRIWPKETIYFEIDSFLNYLYHHADGKPSKAFSNKIAKLTEKQMFSELRKWAGKFKIWVNKENRKESEITFRVNNSKTIKFKFSTNNIMQVSSDELRITLRHLNTYTSRPLNLTKLISNNNLNNILDGIDKLLNSKGNLAARMNYCNKIKFIGPSSMNELIAYANPGQYPLINENANSGMRFFGYDIKA